MNGNNVEQEGLPLLGKITHVANNLNGDVILRVFSAGVRFSTGLASSYELKYDNLK
jgi:hypothetical protein